MIPDLTPEQAYLIAEAHELFSLMENEEEVELLEANNPELLEAYRALVCLANIGRAETYKP